MKHKTFFNWLESKQSRELGAQETLLTLLRPKLNLEDDAILSMNTNDIDDEVINNIKTLGVIANDPELIQQIENGITISDLAFQIGSEERMGAIGKNPL